MVQLCYTRSSMSLPSTSTRSTFPRTRSAAAGHKRFQRMKIQRFSVTNVTSYRERVDFTFDRRLNILIGPNGGGKSNLQKTLALVLCNFFLLQYEFKRDDNEAKVEPLALWTKRALERSLARFAGD